MSEPTERPSLAVVEQAAQAMYERMRLYRRPHWSEPGLGEATRARYRAGARAALEAAQSGSIRPPGSRADTP